MSDAALASPVVVSGSGGSGTRVVAHALRELGYWIGADLNRSLDDQLWNFLFKHPLRYGTQLDPPPSLARELALRFRVHRALTMGAPLPRGGLGQIIGAGWSHGRHRYGWLWVARRWAAMLRRGRERQAWAFKEPHLLFFLAPLFEIYPQCRYVHVLRNGLDMAFSRHDQDHTGWAGAFGLDSQDRSPRNRFEFWARVNRRALEQARGALGQRVLVVRLEALCGDPEFELRRLAAFVGRSPELVTRQLIRTPRLPETHDRYLEHDTAWVDGAVHAELERLGYRGTSPLPAGA